MQSNRAGLAELNESAPGRILAIIGSIFVRPSRGARFPMIFDLRPVLAAALFAVPVFVHAQTSVNLYGLVDAFVGTVKTTHPDSGAGTATVVGSGGLATSFWGIGGSEDLGGGLKAIFALESFMRNDTGDAGSIAGEMFFARNAYVGFAGAFGQISVGRNTTPYFMSAILFNPLVDSFVLGPTMTHTFRGGVEGDTGMSNSVRLSTPTVSGLRADLLWAAGDERDSPPGRKRNRAFDGALFYESGPFAASFAWRKIDLSGTLVSGDDHEQRNLLAGASYDWKVLKLFAQYQDSKDSFAALAPDTDRRSWQLGAAVPFGTGNVLVSWAHSRRDGAGAGTSSKRATWVVGYDHDLSRRTDLYAMYYRDSLEDPLGPREQILALGIRHRF